MNKSINTHTQIDIYVYIYIHVYVCIYIYTHPSTALAPGGSVLQPFRSSHRGCVPALRVKVNYDLDAEASKAAIGAGRAQSWEWTGSSLDDAAFDQEMG